MHGPDPATPATRSSTSSSDEPSRRSPRRTRSQGRPSGRAVAGGLLVTMAALVVFSAYAGAGERPTTQVVVARRDVPPGQVLTSADVEVAEAELSSPLADRTFDSVDAVLGATALGPLSAGDLVQQGAVRTGPGDGRPEFSFPVERERALSGDLRSGEDVDLLATFGTGSDAETVVLARGAQVREVTDARNGTLGSSGRLVLTVGLASGDEVLAVAHASQVATITVVRAGAGGTSGSRTSSAAIEGRS